MPTKQPSENSAINPLNIENETTSPAVSTSSIQPHTDSSRQEQSLNSQQQQQNATANSATSHQHQQQNNATQQQLPQQETTTTTSKKKKTSKKKQSASSSSSKKSSTAQQQHVQFTSKQPPASIQITLNATSPQPITTPKQQYALTPYQPLTIPFAQKFIIGTTKIQLTFHKVQEFDVDDDGRVEIVLIGKKENGVKGQTSSRFVPIKAATVDDLKKQLDEKKKESKQEITRLEDELSTLRSENERLVRTRDDIQSNHGVMQREVRDLQERVAVARQKESDKNEKTRQLRDELKRLEDELRADTEKLEMIQKTKANADVVIKTLSEEIDQSQSEYKRFEKQRQEKEEVLEKSKERLELLKATVAESDKGTLQQVKDLEEKIKKVDAKHDKALKSVIQEVDQVKREAARFTKQSTTAKQKLSKILDVNRQKLVNVPREIVDEIFELRAAIQLKKFNEQYLTGEIQTLLQKPDLQEKVKAADTSTAEQFMVKKTKCESEIIDQMREMTMNQFKLPREAFFDQPDYQPISESDAKKYEQFSQQVLRETSLNHLDADLLAEYIHLSKLMKINQRITDEIEKVAQQVCKESGDNFAKIKAQIEEEAFDDRGDSFVKLKPEDGLKVFQLEDFLEQKPKMQEKGMDKLRLNVKQNVLAAWKRRIQEPDDLLKQGLGAQQ
eukprot:CAMPEP_0117445734 /NCGR_PEP_ID=MMETSP0759-20121206/5956_1 /TAXON_ID=63605 /ORGANISM="Percolomonas cosmopolitus, Strain WS" /LENGTH=671 /DNA_ID=CAMNT_0005237935 /DNA_START=15 /DNA_END=2030 /DNA_ORIENTATION=+